MKISYPYDDICDNFRGRFRRRLWGKFSGRLGGWGSFDKQDEVTK